MDRVRNDELRGYFGDPTGSEVTAVRLSDVMPERVRFLWPGRLPLGKVVVLDGDPSLGKSTLAVDLAARISTGSPMPDGHRLEGAAAVVILSAEDGLADTIRPRVDAAGGDASLIYALTDVVTVTESGEVATRPPSLPADIDRLENLVERLGAQLVIVDVLMAFLGSGVDAHRDQDVRRAMHALAAMAERTCCCVLLLRHLSKSGGANALYRGGGSIGIIGAARAALLVAVDPDDDARRILAVSKSNLAAVPDALAYRLVPADEHACARVQWEGATAHKAADLLAVADGEERTAQADAVEFLHGILDDGPLAAKEVIRRARDIGIADRTLKRAKKPAGVTAYREGFGSAGAWFWKLSTPKEAIEAKEGQETELAPNGILSDSVAPYEVEP